MKLRLPALSALTAVVLLAGCATQSTTSAPAGAQAAPASSQAASAAAAPKASPQAAAPAPKKVSLYTTVYFGRAKYTLSKQAKSELDSLLAQLKLVKLDVIIAVGHTDNKGKASANEKLGMNRANAVKNYLMSKGIAANQVYTDSKIDKPVGKDKNIQANSKRVEIEAIVYGNK